MISAMKLQYGLYDTEQASNQWDFSPSHDLTDEKNFEKFEKNLRVTC